MNRREFHQSLAGLAALHAVGKTPLAPAHERGPFSFSVMLWTIDHKTPF